MGAFEIFINILLALLSAYIVFEYYRAFFDVKNDKKIVIAIMTIDVIWQILSMPFVISMHQLLRLAICVVFIIIVGGCFVGSIPGKLMFALLFNGINMLIELITASIFLCLGISLEEYSLLGSVICQVFALIIVKLLSRFFGHNGVRRLSLKYSGMLILILLGCMFSSYHLFMLTSKAYSKVDFWISAAAAIMLFAATIMVFVLYQRLGERMELKRNNDIYRLSIQMYTEQMKEKKALVEEWRKVSHDLKYKHLYMSELLKNKEYNKLDKYIEDIAQLDTLEDVLIANTDNSFVDAIVNAKYIMARRNDIEYKVKLDIPSEFSYDNADLCVILGNALDNAIEANIREKVNAPYVDLKMAYDDGNLVIIIENPFKGGIVFDKEGNPVTTKIDRESHGFGIDSIRNILRKYNGYMDISVEDGVYKMYIILHPRL